MRIFRITIIAILTSFQVSQFAKAQTVNLTCGGDFTIYEPDRMESTIPNTTTNIDLKGMSITTPIGTYQISNVDEQQITFGSAPSASFDFRTFGTLDRTSGKMQIRWMRPSENAKVQAGQAAKMSRLAQLNCSVAKRLF